MCLAVVAWQAHPRWRLVVLANRDEFHDRPAQVMQPWDQSPALLAGRDLKAGGTWLGVRRDGRFALLTNVRNPANNRADAPSRGDLVECFLTHHDAALDHLKSLANHANRYNGFNLILSDGQSMVYGSNQHEPFVNRVPPGIQGLSNALLNTPWPKTQKTVASVTEQLQAARGVDPTGLMAIMQDTEPVDDRQLPQTGVSLARERLLATPFIVSPDYGTRCTTLILQDHDRTTWVQEDSFDPQGTCIARQRWVSQRGGFWQTFERWPGNL